MKKKTLSQQSYQQLADAHERKRPVLMNCIKAFFVGGLICVIGQAVTVLFITFFPFTEQTAGNPSVSVMVFLSMILTGIGVYDRLGQFAGAGSAVPVTGFGNAVISAAIEHRTEGFVLGVGGNMFKLAGSVIVFGVVSAFFIATIKTLLIQWGIIG
ncbi:stage V sporulation protein AC [Jeotgalibacillus soli]|uniref:Stage V sporulation protein AC n=1 Tax=Jeotgalibacillus soli TaxID=889306 RepID=A0A0C2R628_9BACL|nr:stage V sporulation protein AC [Jeotgalibacillus soli]KIL45715.1 stage V sporulation protein AC [Jeotgalibacillus soli]